MEHSWTKFVRIVLTPLGLGSLLPLCRSGESKLATVLERPAPAKSKSSSKKRRPPTIASLKAKVDRAAREGNSGPSLGSMSYAERDKVLFGR